MKTFQIQNISFVSAKKNSTRPESKPGTSFIPKRTSPKANQKVSNLCAALPINKAQRHGKKSDTADGYAEKPPAPQKKGNKSPRACTESRTGKRIDQYDLQNQLFLTSRYSHPRRDAAPRKMFLCRCYQKSNIQFTQSCKTQCVNNLTLQLFLYVLAY